MSLGMGTSRLLGPEPVMEFTLTLMSDRRVDWQVQTYMGPRPSPRDLKTLLIRLAQAMPDPPLPPQGGTPGVAAVGEETAPVSPLPSPTPVLIPS